MTSKTWKKNHSPHSKKQFCSGFSSWRHDDFTIKIPSISPLNTTKPTIQLQFCGYTQTDFSFREVQTVQATEAWPTDFFTRVGYVTDLPWFMMGWFLIYFYNWLVVWNIFFSPYIWNNHPNWLICFRGVGIPPTRQSFKFNTLYISRERFIL